MENVQRLVFASVHLDSVVQVAKIVFRLTADRIVINVRASDFENCTDDSSRLCQ